MKLFHNVLISLFFILSTFWSQSQGLITNGDFESGSTAWDYWENSTLGFDGAFSVESDELLGSHVGRIDVSTVGDGYWTFKFFNIRLRQHGFSMMENDIMKVIFKARAEGVTNPILRIGLAPENQEGENCSDISDCFWKLNMQDYELVNFDLTDEWAIYEAEIPVYETSDNVQLVIRVGEKPGTYFMDDIELQVVGSLSDQSDWYVNSQARIDTLRKGDFTLTVLDSNGIPIPEVDIEIDHLNHNFEWGTAVAQSTWNSAWQKNVILDLFGGIVNEDHFKWHRIEPTQGNLDYGLPDLFSNWADQNGLVMRGHTLFWPRRSIGLLPGWVNNLSDQNRLSAMEERIRRDMTRYIGKMAEYDVVNEPFHNPYLHETYTDTVYSWIYKIARATDPDAKLYVNEWGNIDLWEHVRYKNFIQNLLDTNTPLDGIGLQAHLNKPVNWKQLKYKLDYLDDFGLPLKITEFDQNVGVNGHSEKDQARDYGIAMRTVFSHPAVEGFYLWTLITGYSTSVESIYNPDGSKRAAADTMQYLLNEVWTTEDEGSVSTTGEYGFNGYYGDYLISVHYLGSTYTSTVNFSKASKHRGINLNVIQNLPPSIMIDMNPNADTMRLGESVTLSLRPMDPEDKIQDVGLFINNMDLSHSGGNLTYVWKPDVEGLYEIWGKVVDDTGQFSYSDTLEINVTPVVAGLSESSHSIVVYPNPTRSLLFVKGAAIGSKFIFSDLSGRNCLEGLIEEDRSMVDVSGLPRGVYMLMVINDFDQVKAQRIMVDK